MLRSLNRLCEYKIAAKDGDIGHVHDLFFDDLEWIIRYVVVDTRHWLPGRRVLISPASLETLTPETKHIGVDLTKEQIENSPPVETDKPLSRQLEEELATYFAWPTYWGPMSAMGQPVTFFGAPAERAVSEVKQKATKESHGDIHLRSVREIVGYGITALDDDIGHVEDFLADDRDWSVRYLVVDTRNWLPGKKVLVAREWIEAFVWEDSKVSVRLYREAIQNGPKYDPGSVPDRDYERRLHEHHGEKPYWE